MKKPNYVVLFVLVLIFVYLFISVSVSAKSAVLAIETQQANITLINKLDLDKDGQITIKESVAAPAVLAAFGKIDADGNGKISRFELSKVTVSYAVQIKSPKFDGINK